jgi:DNA mismatch repair protein MSH5
MIKIGSHRIAFMAHLGSWVPATRCQIGLIDRIFSRVQSRETCAVGSSSFALDLNQVHGVTSKYVPQELKALAHGKAPLLNQVATMLRGSTEKSLLLLDEFGKGTQTTDGLSLLAATISHLIERGESCPRTVCVRTSESFSSVAGFCK